MHSADPGDPASFQLALLAILAISRRFPALGRATA